MAKRILIIDDDNDMLEMFRIIFLGPEFDVIMNNKGMNYSQIEIMKPDLVLMDVNIKGYEKRGDQICKEIKENTKSLPVFLISGEDHLSQIALDCEADGFFNKPFDIAHLKAKINSRLT
jgi:DNA-binding response OmpR family regulator